MDSRAYNQMHGILDSLMVKEALTGTSTTRTATETEEESFHLRHTSLRPQRMLLQFDKGRIIPKNINRNYVYDRRTRGRHSH